MLLNQYLPNQFAQSPYGAAPGPIAGVQPMQQGASPMMQGGQPGSPALAQMLALAHGGGNNVTVGQTPPQPNIPDKPPLVSAGTSSLLGMMLANAKNQQQTPTDAQSINNPANYGTSPGGGTTFQAPMGAAPNGLQQGFSQAGDWLSKLFHPNGSGIGGAANYSGDGGGMPMANADY